MGLKTGAKKQLIVHERNIKSNDNSKYDGLFLFEFIGFMWYNLV